MATTITGFAPEHHSDIENVVEHLEGNHADTLLFVAAHRRSDDRDRWSEAVITDIDPTGISFRLIGTGDATNERIDFGGDATNMLELQGQLFGLIGQARQSAPDHPVTSIEAEIVHTAELRTSLGTVVRAEHIVPNIVELTIGGFDDLPVAGGDEFLYLMVPSEPDSIPADVPFSELDQLPEGSFVGATYTTRRRRPEVGELDMWILLHGHDGGISGWAPVARPGDAVALWGPRSAYEPPEGTSSHLLVCDETGLPAACSIIETLAPGHPVTLVAEAIDEHHRPPLPDHDALVAHWVDRGDAEPGTTGRLLDAVAELQIDAGVYAFGAAESREISAVRRLLRNERGLAPAQVHMTGYWRR